MDGTVLLLPHQERFLQTPDNFPDIRWHFLLAGYGAGKTRSLAVAALKLISELDGEKDDGGLYAKIAVAGYTYAHLEQTFMIDFKAYLDASKTLYHYDTKNHIMTVGTVQVIFLQLLEPERIFGQSIYCALCVDGDAKVWVRDVNGEAEEVMLKQIAPGDSILTRYGWKKVTAKKCSGYRPCIKTNGVYTTLNHPFKVWDSKKHKEVIREANELSERYMVIHSDNRLSSVLQDKTLIEKEVWDITVEDVHEFMVGADRASAFAVKNCDEIDEIPTEDTMIEAMKSVSQRVRQIIPGHRSPFIMAASTAQGMKGFYRLYCAYKKNGVGFVLTRARTQDNWYLPKEYIEDLWKNFTETERKVYMEGEFLQVTQGRVIPGFDWDKNYLPESDLDLELRPDERVYIGMDFNCLVGDTFILTSRGNVPIKDIKVGDYVLTRKGFRKVLTSVSRGVKIVYDFNGLTGTKDHVAITPQGDKQLWEAQNFYCLTEQSIKELQQLSRIQENLNVLRQFCMTGTYGDAGLTVATTTLETILQATEHSCISTFIRSSMVKCLRASKSIIKMAAMTTDLKVLYVCLPQIIQSCIREAVHLILEKKHGNILQIKLWSGISQKKVKHTIQKCLRKLGLREHLIVSVLASIVAEYFRLKSEQLNAALNAGPDTASRQKLTATDVVKSEITEILMLSLRELVLSVEKRLQELLQRNIAKNISVIGSVPATNERKAEVFDIEVEGEHEFFANGILVHNCSYNRASAWISRGGEMHCVKYYDFPDPSESAKVFRYDFPYQDIFWLPDVTSKDLYPQYARELRRYGIHIIHRSKSPLVEDSCFLLSKMCLQGRLKIHSQAVEVADAFATASRDKNNKIPKGVGPTSPIHAIDGARYACSYMALVLPEYRDIRQGLMQHLASFRRSLEEDDNTAPVSYRGAGYTQIEGSAFL